MDDPTFVILFFHEDEFAEATDLQLSQFSQLLFACLCLSQFHGSEFGAMCSTDFASRMDRLPNRYATLWSECYKAMSKTLVQP